MNASFQVGDKVIFGRPNGEKTLGKVVKVNRATLKVEQLEERGSSRDYKPGTIWNIPHNLATPEANTLPTPPVAPCTVQPGDRAEFTKGGHTVTGTVKSVNDKTVTLVDCDDDSRGYRVPFHMVRPVKPNPFKVGSTVSYKGRTAVVTHVRGSIVFVYGASVWGVEAPLDVSDVQLAPKREDKVVLRNILNMYANLSPENLHCDGEISRSQAATRADQYNRILQALFIEIGRTVSESEAYQQA